MRLLLAHSAELALIVTAWTWLSQLIRGRDAATVEANLGSYYWSLLWAAEGLLAIWLAIVGLYWLALLAALVRDRRAARGPNKAPPTFGSSPFLIGVYFFVLACKIMLAGLALALVVLASGDLAASVARAQFAPDLTVLQPLGAATATFSDLTLVLAASVVFLLVSLFAAVHAFGWHRAKAKYGIHKD